MDAKEFDRRLAATFPSKINKKVVIGVAETLENLREKFKDKIDFDKLPVFHCKNRRNFAKHLQFILEDFHIILLDSPITRSKLTSRIKHVQTYAIKLQEALRADGTWGEISLSENNLKNSTSCTTRLMDALTQFEPIVQRAYIKNKRTHDRKSQKKDRARHGLASNLHYLFKAFDIQTPHFRRKLLLQFFDEILRLHRLSTTNVVYYFKKI